MANEAISPYKPHILVAPLDWGLGHATRCVPLIRLLLHLGARVTIAAEGASAALLEGEFPSGVAGLNIIHLDGYNVRLAKHGRSIYRALLWQIPKIRRAIRAEQDWLQNAIVEHGFDAVISDNRYGLYVNDQSEKIPTVFITHQLLIKTGLGSWFDRRLQRMNYHYINRFTECWVPDLAGPVNFAGELSHPVVLPSTPVFYIGLLSRLRQLSPPARGQGKNAEAIASIGQQPLAKSPALPSTPHLFISLSGPEPQRSILEQLIIDQVAHYNGTATIVRGLPGEDRLIPSTNSLKFYNHLSASAYNDEMAKADYVIARSGYSTIMDLLKLGKKAILIPTPGQTEQTYLAGYLDGKKIALAVDQRVFKLTDAVASASRFNYVPVEVSDEGLKERIGMWLGGLRKA